MASSYGPIPDTQLSKTKVFTINLAQAAGTYDLAVANAIGGSVIESVNFYESVAGATFTSVSVQTNDTTPVEMLSAVEGALAGLTVGKNIKLFNTQTYLHTSKKLQYTILGLTGSGTMLAIVRYRPSVSGADIS